MENRPICHKLYVRLFCGESVVTIKRETEAKKIKTDAEATVEKHKLIHTLVETDEDQRWRKELFSLLIEYR